MAGHRQDTIKHMDTIPTKHTPALLIALILTLLAGACGLAADSEPKEIRIAAVATARPTAPPGGQHRKLLASVASSFVGSSASANV